MDIRAQAVRSFRLRAHHLDKMLPSGQIETAAGACGVQNSPPGAWETALFNRVEGCTLPELHDALYAAVEAKDHPAATIFAGGQKYNVKNNAKVTADKAEVDFGVKVYSNGKDGNAKGHFAIVTVKLVAVA